MLLIRPKNLWAAGSLTIAAILTAAPAAAQVAGTKTASNAAEIEDTGTVGEIVVTAQKREQNVQDVSASVQALSAQDLARAGVQDVSRLEQLAPGLVFAKGGNDAKIALRGANSNSTFADNTSIVGFFVDGVFKPRASQQTRAFFDVQRLEVLRGPQGTLYGRNTLGGAINIYTNKPDLTKPGLSGSFDTKFSRFNDLRNELVINAGVSPDFGLRLAVMTENSDGWVKNLVGRNEGISDNRSIRATALWKPAPNVNLTLRVSHISENGNPAGMFAITGACRTVTANGLTDPYGAFTDCQNPRRGSGGTVAFDLLDGIPGQSNIDKRTISRDFIHDDRLRETNATFEGNVDLGTIGLKSISSYTNYTSLLGNDADYSSNPGAREWVQENNKSYTQELQILSKWSGPLQITAGLYGSYDKLFFSYSSLRQNVDNLAARPIVFSSNGIPLSVLTGTPLITLNNSINSTSNNTQFIDSRYLGVFGEATFSITPHLRVIGGVRYNNERKHAINGNAAYTGSLNPVTAPTEPVDIFRYDRATATKTSDVTATFKNVTWRTGVEFDVASDVLFYGTASTGFLSGVMNQNGSVTQPQKSRSFEVGLKTRFWDRKALLNIALYDVRYTDLATTFQIPNPANIGSFLTLSSNGGTLKAHGAEVTFAVRPVSNWHISMAASFLKATYEKFGINLPGGFQVINGAVPASRFIDLSGQRPPYTPKFTFSASTSYDIDTGFGKLTPLVNFRYSDSYFAHGGLPFDKSGFQPKFTQTDLRLGFSPYNDRWSIEAFVENIEDVMINQRTQTGGDGLQQANYGLPRNYGVRAKINF